MLWQPELIKANEWFTEIWAGLKATKRMWSRPELAMKGQGEEVTLLEPSELAPRRRGRPVGAVVTEGTAIPKRSAGGEWTGKRHFARLFFHLLTSYPLYAVGKRPATKPG